MRRSIGNDAPSIEISATPIDGLIKTLIGIMYANGALDILLVPTLVNVYVKVTYRDQSVCILRIFSRGIPERRRR